MDDIMSAVDLFDAARSGIVGAPYHRDDPNAGRSSEALSVSNPPRSEATDAPDHVAAPINVVAQLVASALCPLADGTITLAAMAMKQVVVDSIPQLFDQLRQLYDHYGIACRGQPVADRPLVPAIDRVLALESDDGVFDVDFSYSDLLRLENTAIRGFVRLALPHLAPYEIMSFATVGGVLSTMQHHGSPTRLLDWTRSPWVACYFAVATHWKQDGVIFAFDWVEARSRINKRWLPESQAFHQTGDLDDPLLFSESSSAWLLLYEPTHPSPRMTAQQGFFTAAGRLRSDHGKLLQLVLGELELLRITIPASMKYRVVEHLEAMNLTEHALFPGIEGVGRTVRQTLRCAVPPAENGKEVARH